MEATSPRYSANVADTAPELYGARIKQVLKAISAVVPEFLPRPSLELHLRVILADKHSESIEKRSSSNAAEAML